MLLGKRPRAPMKRTTSMTDIALDLDSSAETSQPPVLKITAIGEGNQPRNLAVVSSGLASVLPPLGLRRGSTNSVPALETAPFLKACALCKGLLLPGHDIFMYRGEIAFCSAECREQQIKLDERKEKTKCSIASRDNPAQAQVNKVAASSKAAGNKETVAAA